MALSHSHRNLIGLSSDFPPPEYPHLMSRKPGDLIPYLPHPILEITGSLTSCFDELTRASSRTWSPVTWVPSRGNSVHKTVRTVGFAIDQLRRYIRLSPFATGSVEFGGILFNAILALVGLPYLNIDFGSEKWSPATLKAVNGDLDPLLKAVLEELVIALNLPPPVQQLLVAFKGAE
jgi:hypothetical protein